MFYSCVIPRSIGRMQNEQVALGENVFAVVLIRAVLCDRMARPRRGMLATDPMGR